jgi:hypothetical protein
MMMRRNKMLKEIKDAWDKMEKANEEYKRIRALCPHRTQTWKDKYGGFWCKDCELFLPRPNLSLKKELRRKENELL